jgi:predicted regulator of Ras-like GTPase activity (Roadblock/LC7/MglB family)
MNGGAPAGELDWLLGNLASTADGVKHSVALSPDGMLLGRSPGLGREEADHLAALAAGVQSLASGASRRFACGEVRQTIVEMDAAFLFITSDHGTCLAVLADAEADAGLIAYEMAVLVTRVGRHMIANPRFPEQDTVSG